MFKINFKENNSLVVEINSPELKSDFYHVIINDDKDRVYLTSMVENYHWYKYWFSNFFKYNIKLLSFDGEIVKIVDEKTFDIKNHQFLINLKSNNDQEIDIWKNYLKLVETTLNVKFDYIINSDLPPLENIIDTIEISRSMYDSSLSSSEKPLTDDYSSLTIIKTLFDVL